MSQLAVAAVSQLAMLLFSVMKGLAFMINGSLTNNCHPSQWWLYCDLCPLPSKHIQPSIASRASLKGRR